MIDIHTHIMPLLDDGAQTFEEAVRMLKIAYANGTNGVVLTPHCAPLYGFYHDAEELREKFSYFSEIVCKMERILVPLYSGMEVLFEGEHRMKSAKTAYLTINDSRYLLLEYMFDVRKSVFMEGIEWAKSWGATPIVAHPERYECVQEDWELILEGRNAGACFQVNEGSLFGKYGNMCRHTAHVLLGAGAVQVVASDAHNLTGRTPFENQTRIWLEKNYGKRYTKKLLHDNPKRIITNQELLYEIGEL